MEILNVEHPIDLWESWNDRGKLHIGYYVYVNTFTFSIYEAQGLKECIIVSLEIIFISYQEWALFNLIPTLQNFGSTIGKRCFQPISQVTTRLEHIENQTFNNLTMRRVVSPNAVQNVGTIRKYQNDQVYIQRFLAFLGGEYNESNETLSVNEDDVASLPNLKDMCRKEALPIGHNN